MIKRKVSEHVIRLSTQYPVVTITGPRQSGKTTLCKYLFKDRDYVSLEDLDERDFARKDPRGFLERYPNGAVIDEVQRVPGLLSYIQTLVDRKGKTGHFILTGSHQFDLLGSVAQSLAGRTALVNLLPFSIDELYPNRKNAPSLEQAMYAGFYPRIHDNRLNPTEAMSFYVSTCIERDLRNIINIKDLAIFETFLKLCAGRCGQILNLSGIANDCGITQATVKSWLSVLEASGIVKLLRPYFKNFNKRLVKSPKLYFLDTGLAAYLLGITSPEHLLSHPLRGPLFESLVVSELLKMRFNTVKTDNLYYFRDNVGNEIDVIMDFGAYTRPVEVKSALTVNDEFFKGLRYYTSLDKNAENPCLIYGGDKSHTRENILILGWMDIRRMNREQTV